MDADDFDKLKRKAKNNFILNILLIGIMLIYVIVYRDGI
jgi:hypothetical protein